MTETTETGQGPAISDDEIRDWARATGRTVGDRGRVPAAMRAEYETMAASSVDVPPPGDPAAPGQPAAAAATAEYSAPARPETRPRTVRPRGPATRRLRAWLTGEPAAPAPKGKAGSKSKPKPKVTHERVPLTRLAERGWGRLANMAERVNVPVGRCMDWQAAYAGVVFDESLKGTVVDRVLQPVARAEEKITGIGSLVAMPLIVGALQAPGNQPDTQAGMVKHQVLMSALEECIEAQLELLGDSALAEKIATAQAERASRKADVEKIIAMIFAPVPGSPEEAAAQSEEEAMRRAAAAVSALAAPQPGGSDGRGQRPPESPTGPRKAKMAVGDDGKLRPA